MAYSPLRRQAASVCIPAVALTLLACGDPLAPTSYDVGGAWLFVETLSDAALGLTCQNSSSMDVTQAGPRFTASGILQGLCTGPSGSDSLEGVFAIDKGEIDGTAVRFQIDGCPYEGVVFGQNADSLKGTMTCSFKDSGIEFNLAGQWRLLREDHEPPTVAGSVFGGGSGASAAFEAGDDTLYVRIHAEDNRALLTMGYQITRDSPREVVRRDSVLLTGTVAEDTLIFPLPLDLRLTQPFSRPFGFELFARDSSGNASQEQLDSVLVLPAVPPSVSGTIGGATNDSVGALRDTIEITITASSPRPLTHFGYRIANFTDVGDSVTSAEKTDSHVFRIPVPFEWKGMLVEFEMFARDQFGLESRWPLGSVRVAVFPSRPTQTFPGTGSVGVVELVLDAARSRLYFPYATASGEPALGVFDLATPGYLPTVPLPAVATGVDLSLGGDALVMSMANERIGFLDLNALVLDSTAPLDYPPANGRYPFRVRVTANGKAFVSIASGWDEAVSGLLVEYDLTTAVQTLRTDVGASGDLGRTPLLARSGDRQRLLLSTWDPSAGTRGQVYRVGTSQFDPAVLMAGSGDVSADLTGDHWLLGKHLLAGDLTSLRTLGTDTTEAWASTLTDDGAVAYVAVPEGVAKFRTSDGVELERILLPDPPNKMLVTSDGATLIAIAPQGLLLVDLR